MKTFNNQFINKNEEFRYFIFESLEKRNIDLKRTSIFIQFIQFFQIISFCSPQYEQDQTVNINHIYQIPFLFARPSSLFEMYDLGYLSLFVQIMTLLFLIAFILTPILLFREKLKNNTQEYSLAEKVNTIYFCIGGFYNSFILIIMMQFLSFSAIGGDGYQNEKFEITIRISAGIFLGFVICLGIIFKDFQRQYQITAKNLERKSSGPEHLLMIIIKMLLVTLKFIDFQQGLKNTILTFLVISYFVIENIDLFLNEPYSRFQVLQISSYLSTFGLLYSVIAPFYFITQSLNYRVFYTLILLVIPLAAAWRLRYLENLFYETAFGDQLFIDQKRTDITLFRNYYKRINFMANNINDILRLFPMQMLAITRRHRQTCVQKGCLCSQIGGAQKSSSGVEKQQQSIVSADALSVITNDDISTYIFVLTLEGIQHVRNFKTEGKNTFFADEIFMMIQLNQFVMMADEYNQAMQTMIILEHLITKNQENNASNFQKQKGNASSIGDENSNGKRPMFDDNQIMIELGKNLIRSEFQSFLQTSINDNPLLMIMLNVDIFIQMQEDNTKMFKMIGEVLVQKLKYLDHLNDGFQDISEMEKENGILYEKLMQANRLVEKFFQKFQTNQTKQFLTFFYVEIQSDFWSAQKAKNVFIPKIYENLQFNVNDRKNAMIVTDSQGEIKHFSNNFPRMLSFSDAEFRKITNIDAFVPNPISYDHINIMQSRIIPEKYSNVVLKPRLLPFKSQYNQLIIFNSFIQFNDLYQEELSFIIFCREYYYSSSFIIISQDLEIKELDGNFLQNILGIEQINYQLPNDIKLPAISILPEISKLILSFKTEETETISTPRRKTINFPEVVFLIPKQRTFFPDHRSSRNSENVFYSDSTGTSQQQESKILNQIFISNLRIIANIDITRNIIGAQDEHMYYMIEVKFFNQQGKDGFESTNTMGTGTNPSQDGNNLRSQSQLTQNQNQQNIAIKTHKLSQTSNYENEQFELMSDIMQENAQNIIETNRIGSRRGMIHDEYFSHQKSFDDKSDVAQQNKDYSQIRDFNKEFEIGDDGQSRLANQSMASEFEVNHSNNRLYYQVNESISKKQDINSIDDPQKNNQLLEQYSFSNKKNNFLEIQPRLQIEAIQINETQNLQTIQFTGQQSNTHDQENIQIKNSVNNQVKAESSIPQLSDESQEFNKDAAIKSRQNFKEQFEFQNEGAQSQNMNFINAQLNNIQNSVSSGQSNNSYQMRRKFQVINSVMTSNRSTPLMKTLIIIRIITLIVFLTFSLICGINFYLQFSTINDNLLAIALPGDFQAVALNMQAMLNDLELSVFENQNQDVLKEKDIIYFKRSQDSVQKINLNFQSSYKQPSLTKYFVNEKILMANLNNEDKPMQSHTFQTFIENLILSMQENQYFDSEDIMGNLSSPSIRFFKFNFLESYKFFYGLSQKVLDDTYLYCDDSSSMFLILSIIFFIISFLLMLLNLVVTHFYQQSIQQIYLFNRHITNISLLSEISRIRVLGNVMEKRSKFHNYGQYIFDSKDQQFALRKSHDDRSTNAGEDFQTKQSDNSSVKQQIDNRFRQRRLEIFKQETLQSQLQITSVLFIYVVMTGFLIYFSINTTGFYSGFKSTFQILSEFSWATSISPLLTNVGFYLYMDYQGFMPSFVLTVDQKSAMELILNEQIETAKQFLSIIQTIQSDKNINEIQNNVITMIQQIDVTDYCDGYKSICEKSLNGILKQGVIKAVAKYFDIYNTFRENQYHVKLVPDQSFLCRPVTLALQDIRLEINNVILQVSKAVGQNTLMISILFTSFFTISLLFYMIAGIPFELNRFHLAKKVVFTIPHYTLLIQESFLKIIVSSKELLGINN